MTRLLCHYFTSLVSLTAASSSSSSIYAQPIHRTLASLLPSSAQSTSASSTMSNPNCYYTYVPRYDPPLPPKEAPAATGWDRLRAAQQEAVRNAQVPQQHAAAPAPVPAAGPPPPPPPPGWGYPSGWAPACIPASVFFLIHPYTIFLSHSPCPLLSPSLLLLLLLLLLLCCILLTSSPFSFDIQQPGYPSTHSPMTYNYTSSSPVAETGHVKWYGQDTTATTAAHHKPQGEGVKMIPLMPTTPDPKQQFYCKELDGSFSLRTVDDIGKNAGPGFWQYGSGGWPFFTRTK